MLADRAFEALIANDYGQFDGLIRVLAPALQPAGLEHLKQRMIDLGNRPVTKPAETHRVEIGWSSTGPIYADEMAERSRVSTVRLALMEIADALGDVDAFIAQYEPETKKMPKIAAEIARRLLPTPIPANPSRCCVADVDDLFDTRWCRSMEEALADLRVAATHDRRA
jgi:uncharacterized protein DUF6880